MLDGGLVPDDLLLARCREAGLPLPHQLGTGTSPVRIREATERDALAVAVVGRTAALQAYAHIFPPTAPQPTVRALWERWRTLLGEVRPPGTGLVSEVDGAVAGSVVAGTEPDEPGAGHVAGLYVHPDRWGGGDGVRLLDAAMDRLRAAGCPEVTLWVLRDNDRARAMYERRGWRPDGGTRTVPTVPEVEELRYRLPL